MAFVILVATQGVSDIIPYLSTGWSVAESLRTGAVIDNIGLRKSVLRI